MIKKFTHAYFVLICLAVCYASIDVWMLSTGDFDRAIIPFMNGIKQFSSDSTLLYPMRDHFKSITTYEY
ncbi:hypothetical protein RF656_21770, partial [Yersinia kristensenii]|nr:hypothetical protein [Yersinia kristensenii]